MSQMGLEQAQLQLGSRQWSDLHQLMTETSTELAGAPTSGLAPQCQGAASRFLKAWSGYASQSAEIAEGFSEALTATARDTFSTDTGVQGDFGQLDGRLGPAL